MHRYEELERLYYRRLYLKIFLIILGIFLGIGTGYYFFNLNDKKVKKVKKEIKPKQDEIKIVKKEINTSNKLKQDIKKYKKTESISFVLPEIKNSLINSNLKPAIKTKVVKKEKTIAKKTSEKKVLVIKTQKVTLNKLIQDYKESPNYHLAILISKLYLNKNNLKEAQKWVLKANNIDPENAESWVLFAEILKRKKQIKKAIEILKVYEETYGGNDIIEKKLRSLNAKWNLKPY